MSIILNINLKTKKKLIYVLKNIYGLGFLYSKQLCNGLGYDYNIKVNELKYKDITKLNSLITVKHKYIIDTELKKKTYDNIQLMRSIRCYKGVRHTYNLPVNGQRTHSNAKTRG